MNDMQRSDIPGSWARLFGRFTGRRQPAARPRLNWAIDTAATPGRWGDQWGDTYFAISLARALRRLDQSVQIDRRDTRDRDSRSQDDVVVTLRGLERVTPRPGPLHLLWVISHPDKVDADEARSYDAVFAASPSWAAARSAEWGIPVSPLLQCTDPEFFHPGRTLPGATEGVLFVGNARRGSHRPVVEAAAEAGARPRIFGTGWEETHVASHLAGTRIPNDDLGAHYAAATVVLSDHWDDMRRAGFLSNRLFDAVACGARVLSDSIDGLDLFDGCVVGCESSDDVREALASDPEQVWPDLAHRMAVAERIRSEHSFERRAEALLTRALELRS
ncbi:glycosyltransferase family protein [Tessaracoccus caeni]|uniref:glycosyltransferase family protein n=1 Tax=Tessaracoccus caeni TaxID=3031239 RepID=UPI0023DC12BD|nr:glycosyltransferase [Tessaracoccus caeni]MDF1488674.1 glycosyltransferase [Tessaracoccus caeni]